MERIEQWLYPLEPLTPRPRTQPMRVLALGPSRSGTDSLRRALEMIGVENVYHGFDCVASRPSEYGHWAQLARKKWGTLRSRGNGSQITRQDFDAIIGHCTGVSDLPTAAFSMELIEAYPEALVILNTRDLDPWHKSIVNTYGVLWAKFEHTVLPYFNARLYWRKRGTREAWEGYFYGDIIRNGKMKYKEHCAMVRGMVPADRLLEWRVQDGWEPLCKFLDVPVPKEEFPYGNVPAVMMERVVRDHSGSIRIAKRNLCISILASAGIIALLSSRMYTGKWMGSALPTLRNMIWVA